MYKPVINNIYDYGKKSESVLDTVSPKLSTVFYKTLELGLMDITCIEGLRSREKQNLFFKQKKSRLQWPKSKHNVTCDEQFSKAIDAAPYVNGKLSNDWRHCLHLAGIVVGVGAMMGRKIRWGGNWDMDGEPITDQDFQDLFHYELID